LGALLTASAASCALPEKSLGGDVADETTTEGSEHSGVATGESATSNGESTMGTSNGDPPMGTTSRGDTQGEEATEAGGGSTGGGSSDTGSGANQGEDCHDNEDCQEGLSCTVACKDWCDQTVWPNPCCTAYCSEQLPWACIEGVGVEVSGTDCPSGTVAPLDPAAFATAPGNTCCMENHCEWSRDVCEVSPVCAWHPDGGPQPNSGTCDPL
jgi:hypothetical protein